MTENENGKTDARKRAEALISKRGFDWRGYDYETLVSDVVCDNDPELLREVLKIYVENGKNIEGQVYSGDVDNISAMELAFGEVELQKVLAEFGFEAFRPIPPSVHGSMDDGYDGYVKARENGVWALRQSVADVADLAYRMHQRDTPPREDSSLPYIVHPTAVVKMLNSWGFYDAKFPLVIALGWAHDLKEDTAVTDEEIVRAGGDFGARLLEGVNALTFTTYSQSHGENAAGEGGGESGADKAAYIRKVAAGDPEFLTVKIADRLCNARERSFSDPVRALRYLDKGAPLFGRIDSLENGANIRKTLESLYAELRRKAGIDDSE